MKGSITDIAGIRVGHWSDQESITGCSVLLCEDGAVGGVDVRGSAPGTRETDLLRSAAEEQRVHAVVLTGGSAFGLAAASGVMRYLEERGVGLELGTVKVPNVPAAVLFDLTLGAADAFPDADAGYAACQSAGEGPVEEGCVGAGTGAAVGRLFGPGLATKSGLGSCSLRSGDGLTVGAIVAVNAFGDVVDPAGGGVLAGTRRPIVGGFLDTAGHMGGRLARFLLGFARMTNTTIGIIATDAILTGEEAQKLAEVAHDGLALTIRPIHTMWDGDTIFALATGQGQKPPRDIGILGALATQAMAIAILKAIWHATPLAGLPSARSLGREAAIHRALSRLASRGKEVRTPQVESDLS